MDKLYIVLDIMQEILPFYILFLFLFKDQLRFSNWINIPFIIIFSVLIIFVTAHSLIKNGAFAAPLLPVSLISMTAGALICSIFIAGRAIINLFMLFIIRSYLDIIYLSVKCTSVFHFLFVTHTPLEGTILAKTLLTAITFPFVFLFVLKLLKPAIDKTTREQFWKWMWFIPFLLYLCFYFMIITRAPSLGRTATLLPYLWIFVTFLTYYLILRMLGEAIQTREMKEALRLAEVQSQIQKQQYENLFDSIEKAKAARHDMRHLLLVLNGYAEKEDIENFREFIRTYKNSH